MLFHARPRAKTCRKRKTRTEKPEAPTAEGKSNFFIYKKHRIFLSIRTIRCFLITVCRFCFLTLCNLGIDFYNTRSPTAFCSYSSSFRLKIPDAFTAPNPNAVNSAAPTHRSQFVMELFPVWGRLTSALEESVPVPVFGSTV